MKGVIQARAEHRPKGLSWTSMRIRFLKGKWLYFTALCVLGLMTGECVCVHTGVLVCYMLEVVRLE